MINPKTRHDGIHQLYLSDPRILQLAAIKTENPSVRQVMIGLASQGYFHFALEMIFGIHSLDFDDFPFGQSKKLFYALVEAKDKTLILTLAQHHQWQEEAPSKGSNTFGVQVYRNEWIWFTGLAADAIKPHAQAAGLLNP